MEILLAIGLVALALVAVVYFVSRRGPRPETPVEDELEIDVQLEGEVFPDWSDAFEDGFEDGQADAVRRLPYKPGHIYDDEETQLDYEDGYSAGYNEVDQRFGALN